MDKQRDNKTALSIMNMAFRLFLEKGYEATNLREIGTEAGINASTIYFYYKSKRELFLDVLDSVMKRHIDMLKDKTSGISKDDDKDVIKKIFLTEIDFVLNDSASYKLMLRYRLFPVMELINEIREVFEKYDNEEFLIWERYLVCFTDGTESENRTLYIRIKKLMNGIVNEMIISGQAFKRKTLSKWWEQYKEVLYSNFWENI